MTHWITDALLHNLEAEGTTACRVAMGRDFWIERFGASALISSRSDIGSLPEDLLTRAEEAGAKTCSQTTKAKARARR